MIMGKKLIFCALLVLPLYGHSQPNDKVLEAFRPEWCPKLWSIDNRPEIKAEFAKKCPKVESFGKFYDLNLEMVKKCKEAALSEAEKTICDLHGANAKTAENAYVNGSQLFACKTYRQIIPPGTTAR
jgi:hypothetical protein